MRLHKTGHSCAAQHFKTNGGQLEGGVGFKAAFWNGSVPMQLVRLNAFHVESDAGDLDRDWRMARVAYVTVGRSHSIAKAVARRHFEKYNSQLSELNF